MAQGSDSGRPDLAIGDSLAYGLIHLTNAGLGGDARVGATPAEVLDKVRNAAATQDLSGKNVVLSSGFTNTMAHARPLTQQEHDALFGVHGMPGRQDRDGILDKEVQTLMDAGAHVTLLGVSHENTTLNSYNEELAALARRHGATPAALSRTGADRLHPDSYTELLGNVITANGHRQRQPASALPPPEELFHEATLQTVRQPSDGTVTKAELRGVAAQLNGFSAEDIKKIQTLIKQADHGRGHYDLGTFGDQHDGVDGIAKKMTDTSLALFEKEHGLAGASLTQVVASLKQEAAKNAPPETLLASDLHPGQTPSGALPPMRSTSSTKERA